MQSLYRYPGGKGKLLKQIGGFIHAYYDGGHDLQYREPFFGGGSVGLHVMDKRTLPGAWLNDFDPGITAIWDCVIKSPDELCDAINKFTPDVDTFFQLKSRLIDNTIASPVALAAAKIAVHQMSYSGLGTKAGGPIGGREQKSDYDVGCRWNADSLCDKVKKLHTRLVANGAFVTNSDFSNVIDSPGEAFVYLDPPYYVQGGALYQHAFDHKQHVHLADCLKATKNPWLLSYDDAPEVRELYSFAEIKVVKLNYTIAMSKEEKAKDKKTEKSELIIFPRSLAAYYRESYEVKKPATKPPATKPRVEENRGYDMFEDSQ